MKLGGTRFQHAALCKRYIRDISCQQRDIHEALYIQLKSVWPFKKNWVCLLQRCIYRYLLWFIYQFLCVFKIFIHRSFTNVFFFLSFFWTVSFINLHLTKKELEVWPKREQKINASTAVWHFVGARLSHFEGNPKDSFQLWLLGLKEREG